MKIIISTLSLRNALNELDESVVSIETQGNSLKIKGKSKYKYLYCEIRNGVPFLNQSLVRWDWVRKLMNQIDEQPALLEISDSQIDIKLSY
jgi:hypothetical protein